MEPSVDEHFPKTILEPKKAPISVDQGSGSIKVLSTVVALHERSFETNCTSCNADLSFGVQHIHKTCSSWTAWFWNTPDAYHIKCPVCYSAINVKTSLPSWLIRRI